MPSAAALAATIGGIWLVLWSLGLPQQLASTPVITMKSNMALALVLASAALIALTRRDSPRFRIAGFVCALIVLLIGSATTFEHISHRDLHVDQLLFTEPPGAAAVDAPNRMGPPGAISLTLVGIALLALAFRRRKVAPSIGLGVCLIALVPAVGYLYGAYPFYGKPGLTGIAWSTVIALAALGVGLALSSSEHGPLLTIERDDIGGTLLRRLLPISLIAPIVLGLLRTLAETHRLVGPTTGRALLVLSFAFIFSAVVWVTASRLSSMASKDRTIQKALRQSEERFRLIFDRAGVGVMELDDTDRLVAVNERTCEILGYDRDRLLGMSVAELTAAEDRDRTVVMNAKMRNGSLDRFATEKRYVKGDGTPVWVHVTVSAVRDETGRFLTAISTVEDITVRKRAEEALRASERALRQRERELETVLDLLPVGVFIADKTGCIVHTNSAGSEIWGKERPPVESAGDYGIFRGWLTSTGEQLKAHEWAGARALAGERVVYQEVDIETFDGRRKTILNGAVPLRGENGEITGAVTVNIDITDQKRADRELHDMQERFGALVKATSDVIYVVSPDWKEMRQLEGRGFISDTVEPNANWLGEYVPPEDQALVLETTQDAIRRKGLYELEHRVRRIDGSIGWTLSRAVPLLDVDGRVTSWFGAAVDITERKLAQEALIRSEKLASVGRMAATVAHEINNPLAMIVNSVYIASLDPNLTMRARQSLATAEQELERVAHLTRQTLGFYRENTSPSEVDVPTLVTDVIELYAPKFMHRDVRVESSHTEQLHVHGIAGEIRQVVSNLISNAIDACPRDGRLRVKSSRVHLNGISYVRVSFADNGEGIAPENLSRIFEPFFTTKEAVGTGLGLWVSCEIVKRHNGKILVRSRRDQGTVFSVLLPESEHLSGVQNDSGEKACQRAS